jgi:hypothetical protein
VQPEPGISTRRASISHFLDLAANQLAFAQNADTHSRVRENRQLDGMTVIKRVLPEELQNTTRKSAWAWSLGWRCGHG